MRNSRESGLKKEIVKVIDNMEDKEKIVSLISITHSFFKLDALLFLIIYPYKLPGLSLYPYYLL